MTFVERLNFLIKDKNINRAKLTEELHIGKNQITYWEQKGNIPDGNTLLKLANYFDVSVDYLVGNNQTEQSLTESQQKLYDSVSDLPDDDISKVIEYIELLKLKNKNDK